MFRLIKTNGPTPFQLDKHCHNCTINYASYTFYHWDCAGEERLCTKCAIDKKIAADLEVEYCIKCEQIALYGQWSLKKDESDS